MNTELKAILELAFDILKVGQDAAAKRNFFLLLPGIFEVAQDIPAVVQNIGDLKAEIAALPGSQQEADLLAFIQQKFADAGTPAKAQAILAASLKLVQDVALDTMDLVAVIKA